MTLPILRLWHLPCCLALLLSACHDEAKCGQGASGCQHGSAADTTANGDTTASDTTASDATASDDTATADTSTAIPEGVAVDSAQGNHKVWFTAPKAAKVGETLAVQATVQTANGSNLTGLSLAPSYIHVGMGHGGSKVPVAQEVGAGVYVISNLVATMQGEWRLRVTLPGKDTADVSWQVSP